MASSERGSQRPRSDVLVVEGVTGAGKSSVLREIVRALSKRGGPVPTVIPEDDTLGRIMSQARDPAWRGAPTFEALEQTLDWIESGSLREGLGARFLVERFHLTAYALHPDWSCFAPYDARLAAMRARLVLLTYPEAMAAERSLDRPDRVGERWADEMASWYGSREAAVAAVRDSLRRREEALALTALPHLVLDTTDRDWTRLAAAALAFWDDAR